MRRRTALQLQMVVVSVPAHTHFLVGRRNETKAVSRTFSPMYTLAQCVSVLVGHLREENVDGSDSGRLKLCGVPPYSSPNLLCAWTTKEKAFYSSRILKCTVSAWFDGLCQITSLPSMFALSKPLLLLSSPGAMPRLNM